MTFASDDYRWMGCAIGLGKRGRGRTGPNPNVGCVIVKDNRMVGYGWTQDGGRPHAEAMALEMARELADGATAFVTLEPCVHKSERGPSCASLLEKAGVRRVVAAAIDPDPRMQGSGLRQLESNGIAVASGLRAAEAEQSMAGFFARQSLGRPHVTLKLAMSIDGKIGTASGESKWITSDRARLHAHMLRAQSDAILVGGGTFRADAPRLDVRLHGLEQHSPARLLLSSHAPAPEGWDALTKVEGIASCAANWLLVEGGAKVAASFLRLDMVDTLVVYRAPLLMGDGIDSIGDLGSESLLSKHGRWAAAGGCEMHPDSVNIYDRVRG